MLIVRTPCRVSFFGGGTDIPGFFEKYTGNVISTTIDKYCYVLIKKTLKHSPYNFKAVYSKIETANSFNQIQHPLIKRSLSYFNNSGAEIHYDSDLPARNGLGSSSAFGIGLAYSFSHFYKKRLSKKKLANLVIQWERKDLKEKGGYQDQIACAYGGLNKIHFKNNGDFSVNKIIISENFKKELFSSMMLCQIPVERFSFKVSPANHIKSKKTILNLKKINDIAIQANKFFKSEDLPSLLDLIDQSWQLKKNLKYNSNEIIEDIYKIAKKNGAYGGKLLGAGAGGFFLLCFDKDKKNKIKRAMKNYSLVDFNYTDNGPEVLYQKI